MLVVEVRRKADAFSHQIYCHFSTHIAKEMPVMQTVTHFSFDLKQCRHSCNSLKFLKFLNASAFNLSFDCYLPICREAKEVIIIELLKQSCAKTSSFFQRIYKNTKFNIMHIPWIVFYTLD